MLVVVFRVSEARYAVPCRSIIEVIPLLALQAVPHAPPGLVGALLYRGKPTPVFDLCQLIGKYPCAKLLSSRVVLVDCALPGRGTLRAGLLGEHMTEARHLKTNGVPGVPLAKTPYLGEVVIDGKNSFQLLNVEQILLGSGATIAEHFSHGRLTSGVEDREAAQP